MVNDLTGTTLVNFFVFQNSRVVGFVMKLFKLENTTLFPLCRQIASLIAFETNILFTFQSEILKNFAEALYQLLSERAGKFSLNIDSPLEVPWIFCVPCTFVAILGRGGMASSIFMEVGRPICQHYSRGKCQLVMRALDEPVPQGKMVWYVRTVTIFNEIWTH